MTPKSWILVGFTILLTALYFWPAYIFKGNLERATNGKLKLLNVQGSIWKGSAVIGLFDGRQTYTLPGQVQWAPTFLNDDVSIGVSLNHPNLLTPILIGIGREGYKLKGGQARIPANWLAAAGAPFNTIKPEGILELSWQDINPSEGNLNVTLIWRDAQSALSSIRPLGEYKTSLTGVIGGTIDMHLSTNSGALMLEGQGRFEPGKRMHFTGYAWAKEESKAALTGLLSQMGRLENGRYRLGVF